MILMGSRRCGSFLLSMAGSKLWLYVLRRTLAALARANEVALHTVLNAKEVETT